MSTKDKIKALETLRASCISSADNHNFYGLCGEIAWELDSKKLDNNSIEYLHKLLEATAEKKKRFYNGDIMTTDSYQTYFWRVSELEPRLRWIDSHLKRLKK